MIIKIWSLGLILTLFFSCNKPKMVTTTVEGQLISNWSNSPIPFGKIDLIVSDWRDDPRTNEKKLEYLAVENREITADAMRSLK